MGSGQCGSFRFHAIPERVLFAGDLEDRLDRSARYPKATPEAALCHWLYLAQSRFSRMRAPSPEADVSELDRGRAGRLAIAMGIGKTLETWLAEADSYADEVPDYAPGLG